MSKIKEANLVRRAIKERWPIPKAERQKLIKALLQAVSESEDVRSRVAAARAVIEADKLNMEQEKRDAGGDKVNVTISGKVSVAVSQEMQQALQDDDTRELFAILSDRLGGMSSAN